MRCGPQVLIGSVLLASELLGPVAASQEGDEGGGLRPGNLEVAPPLQPVLERLWEGSPTFRRQCARIAAARQLKVTVLPEDRPRLPSVAARSKLDFQGGDLVSASVYVDVSPDAAPLLAHEFEHILEQLDGVNLGEQADNEAVWKSGENSFETRRAVEAGHRVSRELMDRPGRTVVRVNGPAPTANRTLTVSQANPDATPISTRLARVAAEGRHLVFISPARLVAEDRNALNDVYVLDLETGAHSLESAGSGRAPADGDSRNADISRDGRFVVFESAAGNLVHPPLEPGTSHIFLRDRHQGTTRLLSTAVSGGPASGPSRQPAINADGTVVVFESAATDLIEKGTGGVGSTGIYLMGLSSGMRTRVDARGDGARPSGQSMSPGISADGRFVVFAAKADLTCRGAACVDEPRDGNGVTDVYLRDLQTNVLRRISRSAGGHDPDGASYDPAISGDGRFVAFVSQASNLTRESKGRAPQIYVHDLRSGATELISRTGGGLPGNNSSLRPALSYDGSTIAFQSLACDLLCHGTCQPAQRDINLLWDVFVHDRLARRTVRVSTDDGEEWMENSRAPSLDHSGRLLVFGSRHPVDAQDSDYDEDLFVMKSSGVQGFSSSGVRVQRFEGSEVR